MTKKDIMMQIRLKIKYSSPIYKNEFNLLTSNNLLSYSIFKYLIQLKNNDNSKNEMFNVFSLLKKESNEYISFYHKDLFNIHKLKKIIIDSINSTNKIYDNMLKNCLVYKYKP